MVAANPQAETSMSLSVFDLFKIGIGPSSSHTVGPMRAAARFAEGLRREGLLEATASVKVELYGSLGATGKGHGSDKAVLLGLEGEQPDTVDTAAIPARLDAIRSSGELRLLGERPIRFVEKEHLALIRKPLAYHPNGMIFRAFDAAGLQVRSREYYSVGGGFVVDDEAAGLDRIVEDRTPLAFPFKTARQLLDHCVREGLSISQLMAENEKAWRPAEETRTGLVLHYYARFIPGADDDGVVRFLLTAAAIGILYKENASISGAEVGCQGEVGVACSMAAGALCEVLGGSVQQVENAAEIGMEHNLGLTCDPVGGLVQVPCIERNAMASVKAINAARMALRGDGQHFISLDKVIRTMRQTGADMKSKYKETARGGLAVNIIEC